MFDDLMSFTSSRLALLFDTAFDTTPPTPTPALKRLTAVKTVASNLVSLVLYAAMLVVVAHAAVLLAAQWLGVDGDWLLGAFVDGVFRWDRLRVAFLVGLVLIAGFVGGMRLFQVLALVTRRFHVFSLVGLLATMDSVLTRVPAILRSRDLDELAAALWAFASKSF